MNLLVLDEPTNHLDMVSKDILKAALVRYDGTLIVVSHDRDFLQGLTETIYEFSHHKVRQFKGDIADFLRSKKMTDFKELETAAPSDKATSDTPASKSKADYLKSKEKESGLRKIRNKIAVCEKEIEQSENQIKDLDNQMANGDFTNQQTEMQNLCSQYEKLKKQLSEQMQQWEDLQMELEEAEKQC